MRRPKSTRNAVRSLRPMDTFQVRVWRPDGEERPEGLRGTVVRLSSGRTLTFTEPQALVSFLADAGGSEGDVAPATPIGRDRIDDVLAMSCSNLPG